MLQIKTISIRAIIECLRGYKERHPDGSLLSQVLKRELHLTLDHGVPLARYLGLDSAETEYLLQLITYEKAGTTELKEHVQLNLDESRRDQLEISKHLGDSTHNLQPEDLAPYCSHWLYPFFAHACIGR